MAGLNALWCLSAIDMPCGKEGNTALVTNTQKKQQRIVVNRSLFVIHAVYLAFFSGPLHAGLLYGANFEGGTAEADTGSSTLEIYEGGSISVVANPQKDSINASERAARCRIPQGYKRAELSSERIATEGRTRLYKASYYIPNDFYEDANISWFLLSQWKTYPCGDHNGYSKQICYSCSIFNDILRWVRAGDEMFNFRWRAEPDCHEHVTKLAKGQWNSIMMEIKWTNSPNGYMKLWINNAKEKELRDIKTLFDDFKPECNIYWAVGLYGDWAGAKQYLDLYIDNIEIWDTSDVVWTPRREACPDVAREYRLWHVAGGNHGNAMSLKYFLPRPGFVTIKIFNTRGQAVWVLPEGYREVGEHAVSWRPRAQSGHESHGAYNCRMDVGRHIVNGRLLIIE